MSELSLSFLFLLFISIPLQVISQDINAERTVLLNFKQQLGNPPSIESWNSSSSPCDWPEIKCTGNSVTEVHLRDKNITGRIPPTICDLKNLTFLDLAYNYIPGEFPTVLYNCSKLQVLDLSQNYFVGPIPDDIDRLSTLVYLDIGANNFSGNIPPSIRRLSELQTLYIYQNEFINGTFPKEIGDLSNLEVLGMAYNEFVPMKIPQEFGQMKKLRFLWMAETNLIGEIPESFNNLCSLEHLDLSRNNLEGPIPSRLLLLKNLTNLYLFNNKLSGEIPGGTAVRLDLSNNRISGQISQFLLEDIEHLNLHSNLIHGDLPILPPNITFFSVSNNTLTGDISGICNMKFVEILDLSHNNFTRTIPPCIGSFSKSLSSLNLNMNKFHGIIPPTFAKGCGLKNLNLNGNHLEGPLTPSISNCKDLEVLDLGNNKINGTFPHWIEELSELQVLVLRSNKFQDSIDASQNPQSLPKLRILDLSYNNFSGPLPTSYLKNFKGMMKLDEGKAARYMQIRDYRNLSYDYSVTLVVKGLETELVKILTIFTSIDLSNNNFEGEVLGIIGELSSLRGLNLSHNNLVGQIPSSLRNLTSLEWLDLSSNKLGGQIPRELADLTFLASFNVSYNQLVGPIPQGKQFNTFGNGSYKGNKGLCGLPLSRGCSSDEQPPQPPPGVNLQKDDGSKFEFGWEPVVIGYGFGFVFGGAIGYIGLRMGKFKWLMSFFEGYIARKARRV